ncbi:methylamine utilization protein [Pseudoalteromonas sp. HM-SA03]|uniref:methylamine utilization protein n=1 Tax=Pseudoalteromonas sp. HM-SA03 TaxID=2029678 RepID=UPI000BAE5993|nr:methylamine utilization protein [Pseudoalteromonas sp. HM-SA03]PAX99431.1 methylamine utilization protein [Pseudoalteromonas sp. HM-SA03]
MLNLTKFGRIAVVMAMLQAGLVNALEVQIVDADKQPLANAAVWLQGDGFDNKRTTLDYKMEQKDKAFVPHILMVQAGTQVSFPNLDPILHHVYSFSAAKPFELKLYRDDPKQVLFDQTGVVELGCNIHDWMLGYIVVVDSPLFAVTDSSGKVSIDLGAQQASALKLNVWHERFENIDKIEQHLLSAVNNTQAITYQIKQTLVAPLQDFSDGFDDY